MTKRLEQAIDTARALTSEQQELLAVELLDRAHSLSSPPARITPQERAELEAELAAARRGDFTSDDEVAAIYAKYGAKRASCEIPVSPKCHRLARRDLHLYRRA